MTRFDHQGTTALVTGASSGIGAEFARALAARGSSHLVLTARNEARLGHLSAELTAAHGVRTTVICVDLAQPDGVNLILEQLGGDGVSVDVVVNNAGFASHGLFASLGPTSQVEQITLNCTSLVALTSALLPSMVSRGNGAIVNVASTAAFQPLPYMAVYGATKAFVLSFSEALWGELRHSGVRVVALCPGATDTAFFERVGTSDASVGRRQDPGDVVAVALRALDRDRMSVVSGRSNAALAQAPRLVTRRAAVRITARTLRPSNPAVMTLPGSSTNPKGTS